MSAMSMQREREQVTALLAVRMGVWSPAKQPREHNYRTAASDLIPHSGRNRSPATIRGDHLSE